MTNQSRQRRAYTMEYNWLLFSHFGDQMILQLNNKEIPEKLTHPCFFDANASNLLSADSSIGSKTADSP